MCIYTTVGNCAHGACHRYQKSLLTLNHDISRKLAIQLEKEERVKLGKQQQEGKPVLAKIKKEKAIE